MRISKACLTIFLSLQLFALYGQQAKLDSGSAHRYIFPIQPQQRNHLSATYGEMRSTHFHAGLDIRTKQQIGLPVHATLQGYVYRLRIQRLGYGRALYVKHINGTISLYAHLHQFADTLEQWTLQQQYAKQSFEVDLYPSPKQFLVHAGQIIAYSGNTGSSSGPHLHFELRNAQERALNPLHVGRFSEIVDVFPPKVYRIAFTTLNMTSRINDKFGRFEFPVSKKGAHYRMHTPVHVAGCVGVELLTKDMHDKGKSSHGVTRIRMLLRDEEQFSQNIQSIDFDQQHMIALHMNYLTYLTDGRRFSKLYVAQGNTLPFYQVGSNRGQLCLSKSNQRVPLTIHLWDARHNQSHFRTLLNASKPVRKLSPNFSSKKPHGYYVHRNTLFMHVAALRTSSVLLLTFSTAHTAIDTIQLQPAYTHAGHRVYLWDLRQGIPMEAYKIWHGPSKTLTPLSLNIEAMVPDHAPYYFENDHVIVDFDTSSLYDTLFVRFAKEDKRGHISETFYFYNEANPIKTALRIALKPKEKYIWNKTSVYLMKQHKVVFYETYWRSGMAYFQARDLGMFTLLTDTIPPKVLSIQRVASTGRIRFYVSDDVSGIANWTATLNDTWLLLEYHERAGYLSPRDLADSVPLVGSMTLQLTDKQKNTYTYTYDLKP